MKLSDMEAYYPQEMTTGRQKAALGVSSGYTLHSQLSHNEQFQDILSSTIDLGSLEAFQDADLPFEGLDTIEEVESCEEHPPLSNSLSLERTQQFIEEMDIFIKQHEENYPITPCMESSDPKVSPQLSESVDDETKEAVRMLDALIHADIALEWREPNYCQSTVKSINSSHALTLENIPNISNHSSVDSFFEKSSTTPFNTLSPASSTSTLVDFSPPSSVPSPKQYKCAKGKEHMKSKRQKLTIKDKKERKKWQNVEAARRYRDKKRTQVNEYQLEAKELLENNSNLKEKLREVENELSTMKKLMTELGMIKVVQK